MLRLLAFKDRAIQYVAMPNAALALKSPSDEQFDFPLITEAR